MKNFLIRLLMFSALIAAVDLIYIHFTPVQKHAPHTWMLVCFFAVLTALFHFLSLHSAQGKPQGFIRFYMGSTALRLFLYVLIILAYGFYDKPSIFRFAIGFMVHYFAFTLFEIPLLLKALNKPS